MTVPEIVPIAHEPEYRTGTIGRYAGGQFFASVTYAEGPLRRLYVVLHRFDADGRHVHSDISRADRPPTPSPGAEETPGAAPDRAEARLAGLLDGLDGREFGDIAIRPFRVVFDGVVFGLVTERHAPTPGEEHDWAELYPDRLGFSAPWNGLYDT
ncbi:hypothetical protein [Streptomyces sp. NPDC088789]|uniref:hypothetical protein n=1 Tax=Streptomyces sp. NPDC088789 TaxID=3365899 RepID=UPI00382E9DA6